MLCLCVSLFGFALSLSLIALLLFVIVSLIAAGAVDGVFGPGPIVCASAYDSDFQSVIIGLSVTATLLLAISVALLLDDRRRQQRSIEQYERLLIETDRLLAETRDNSYETI